MTVGDFIRNNPVWVMSSIQAIVAIGLNLVIEFGFDLTAQQVALINALVLAVLAFVLGLWAQRPVERLVEREALRVRASKYTS